MFYLVLRIQVPQPLAFRQFTNAIIIIFSLETNIHLVFSRNQIKYLENTCIDILISRCHVGIAPVSVADHQLLRFLVRDAEDWGREGQWHVVGRVLQLLPDLDPVDGPRWDPLNPVFTVETGENPRRPGLVFEKGQIGQG